MSEPAFPSYKRLELGDKSMTEIEHAGMSLRDYFAAKALTCLADLWRDSGSENDAWNVAIESYRIADAMLAERERGAK